MKTELSNYTLWFDGYIEVNPSDIMQFIQYNKLCVPYVTEDIKQFNKIADNPITVKCGLLPLDTSWNIPEHYLQLDIMAYITEKLIQDCLQFDESEFDLRYNRVKYEMSVYKELNLLNLLRTMVYIIDMYKQHSVVWGVGRGSSVSSYILYLLEVHNVDSVLYDLDFSEFLGA
jgi:DNA polymerase III alpha subunit